MARMTSRQSEAAETIRRCLKEAAELGHPTDAAKRSKKEALEALFKATEYQAREKVGGESRMANSYLRIGVAASKACLRITKTEAFADAHRRGDIAKKAAMKASMRKY